MREKIDCPFCVCVQHGQSTYNGCGIRVGTKETVRDRRSQQLSMVRTFGAYYGFEDIHAYSEGLTYGSRSPEEYEGVSFVPTQIFTGVNY